MRYQKHIKWVGIIVMILLLTNCSLAEASPGKHRNSIKKPMPSLLLTPRDNDVRVRMESKFLQADIKQQDDQVKQLTRSVNQLNSQVQKQLEQVQKDKIQFSPQELKILSEHLQQVKNSSQQLNSGDKKYQQVKQQFKYKRNSREMVETLLLAKAAQKQQIVELTALEHELQKLMGILAPKTMK